MGVVNTCRLERFTAIYYSSQKLCVSFKLSFLPRAAGKIMKQQYTSGKRHHKIVVGQCILLEAECSYYHLCPSLSEFHSSARDSW